MNASLVVSDHLDSLLQSLVGPGELLQPGVDVVDVLVRELAGGLLQRLQALHQALVDLDEALVVVLQGLQLQEDVGVADVGDDLLLLLVDISDLSLELFIEMSLKLKQRGFYEETRDDYKVTLLVSCW